MKKLKVLLLFFIIIILSVCSYEYTNMSDLSDFTKDVLKVHFLDVGQADCTVIELPTGQILMIDAGNNDDDHFIKSYLRNLNIDTIDYLIGTHPHEDHIGSLDEIINNYEVKNLYMPKAENDTKSYRDVMKAVKNHKLDIITTNSDTVLYEDEQLKIKALAPCKDYDDLNNASIVLHLTYKNSSFLFPADAEKESEYNITGNISADVLKVGHHGSSTSTSDYFLSMVDPMYAVISCGKNNDYGTPTMKH